MPIAQISNPLGINAAQGNEVYTSPTIIPFGADPAGNANTITWMTTANPTVITTTAAHGFITGKQVLVNTSTAFVATGTLPDRRALRLHGPVAQRRSRSRSTTPGPTPPVERSSRTSSPASSASSRTGAARPQAQPQPPPTRPWGYRR